jgi:hypothetical protein
MLRAWLSAIVVIVFGLAGCTDARSGAAESFAATDSAGIRIASNVWSGAWEVPEWQLAAVPALSIGDPAPSPEYELHRVYYARTTPAGRIIAAVNLHEIRIYEADGRYVRTIGRQGSGPGEFEFLWDAHPVGDTLIRSLDVANRRVTIFAARDDAIRTESTMIPVSSPNGAGLLADGSYAGLSMVADRPNERVVLLIAPDGASADTLGVVSAPASSESAVANARPMFEPAFSSTAAGRWVWAGWEGRYEIRRYAPDSRLEQIVRSTFAGEPVTDAIRQSVTEAVPAGSEAARRTPVFPDRLPAWNKLLASPSGWLWVRREPSPLEEAANTWDIFDPEGRLAAYIRIPMTGRLSEVGDDYVLGVFRNELDVESIRRYAIVRTDGA